ncbi:MAG: ferritin-like domain-containing protein [Mycobacteriales bacterium]
MAELAALRQALAAEQAIVYGYGVVGAHLKGADRKFAAERLTSHQELRDRIASLVTALGAVPPPAQPAYRLPSPVIDAASARQLAAHLEDGAAGVAWDLAAATAPQSTARGLAVMWLTDSAVAAARWGAGPTALPGRPATPTR